MVREFHLPFGVTGSLTSIFENGQPQTPESDRDGRYHLTFVPPPWLSSIIFRWEFYLQSGSSTFPTLGISFSPIKYNSSPLLLKAVKSCDAVGLQELFKNGLASSNDYIILNKRPVTLLKVPN
jgi:hypothetical protein